LLGIKPLMPRHRQERGRTRRALRRERASWRSVLSGRTGPTGLSGASGASETSGPARVSEAGGTTETRGTSGASGSARVGGTSGSGEARGHRRAPGPQRGRTAPGSCRQRVRLARSLLLTPWFAAGAGIVIAAAVAVGSPAALTYSPSSPVLRCSQSGCVSPAPDQPDVATASPGVALKVGGAHGHGAAARSAPSRAAKAGGRARYRVGYRLITHQRHRFVALITMPSGLAPGSWSLAFAFSSARVEQVWGAQWRPLASGEGGTALWSAQWAGDPLGWPTPGQLVIMGRGAQTAPTSCRLNGVRCSFG
jgi:hypothetical protein